jgi:hypothetical protein
MKRLEVEDEMIRREGERLIQYSRRRMNAEAEDSVLIMANHRLHDPPLIPTHHPHSRRSDYPFRQSVSAADNIYL